ncbi:MAG: hypothetical protein LH471_09970 [Salinibacterium sp.]|nr:hypothetical protein [Salinibacterium sp.]
MSHLLAVLVASEEELAPLLMPPLAFAGVTLAVFAVLGFVVWSYRDVANRNSRKTGGSTGASHGAGH